MATTTLPLEIVFSWILPRLPVKTLIQFKTVSKSFYAEISSPNFIKLHHLTALSSDSNRFLVIATDDRIPLVEHVYMYSLDSLHSPPSICPLPKPSVVVASCESYLLVIHWSSSNDLVNVILINPSTRTYLKLPNLVVPQEFSYVYHGLCHCMDKFGDDFKVARFVEFSDNNNSVRRQVVVYSLRTGMWKLVENTTPEDNISWSYLFHGVLCQRLFHLIFIDRVHKRMKRIGCFDINAERWGPDVPLPDTHLDVVKNVYKPFDLGVLDDQLCLTVRNLNDLTYDLWVMRHYGVKESWVKMITVCVSNTLCLPRIMENVWLERIAFHPVTCRKGSPNELLYKDSSSKLFWYNLENKESIEVKFPGLYGVNLSKAYVCKGSLLNVPGSQPITSTWILGKNDSFQGSLSTFVDD